MEVRENCGVVGLVSLSGGSVSEALYRALLALQHRGQDAAGMVIHHNSVLYQKKGLGFVRDIFTREDRSVPGSVGIGHTRYPTTGRCFIEDVQPVTEGNVAFCHNGHVANYDELRDEIEKQGIKFRTKVDSEIILHLYNIAKGSVKERIKTVMERLDGSYSVAGIVDGKLIIFRDPHGIRPLVYGKNDDFLVFASETVALDMLDVPYEGDVLPGEMVMVGGNITREQLFEPKPTHCMFEYVYFSRPDSSMNGVSVYEVRKQLGKLLAREHPTNADVVIPVPDTGRTAASAYSQECGIPLDEGLIKNRYIARTFIMPRKQEERSEAVRLKVNPLKKVIKDKRVVVIDDSIVRGTTTKELVGILRKGGAKEVHLRITCPQIKHPCFYGIDMPTYAELIAARKTVDEVREFVGADTLGHLSVESLKKAIGLPLCTACLTGEYPTKKAKQLAEVQHGRCAY